MSGTVLAFLGLEWWQWLGAVVLIALVIFLKWYRGKSV